MPKRNASGGGSIRQRADKTWEARYTVGRNPVTGRQIQKSVYGRSQQEVRKKLAAAVAALDAGTYCEPSKLTLSGWLDTWLETYNQNVKVRTKQLYERIINTRIRPALGSVRLAKLDSVIIQKYYNSLTADGLAAKTVRNLHGVLHKALAQAVVLGYIPRNPSDNCELPKKQQLEIHPFEGGSLQNFLQAIQGDAYERLFLVALYTGLREGEVLGLPWDAVDFKKGTLRIYQQVALVKVAPKKYERQITPPKNGKERTFKVAPSVLNLLREERACQNQRKLIAGQLWNETDFVFTTQLGNIFPRNTVYEHFKRCAATAGRPDARFHDLRHTFACSALESGVSPKTVSEILGHASVAFTLDVYAHYTQKLAEDSADKMESFIQKMAK